MEDQREVGADSANLVTVTATVTCDEDGFVTAYVAGATYWTPADGEGSDGRDITSLAELCVLTERTEGELASEFAQSFADYSSDWDEGNSAHPHNW